jgi:hypothetical protein
MSLYLIASLQLSPSLATFVNQLITASTYLLALGWGVAADSVLGRARTAAIGLSIYVLGAGAMLGCSLMATDVPPGGDPADVHRPLQPGGVALLFIGVAAFVGGASAVVATLGTLLADQRPNSQATSMDRSAAFSSDQSIDESARQVGGGEPGVLGSAEESADAFLGVFRGVFSTYFALLNLASVVAFVAAPALAARFGFAGSFGLATASVSLAFLLLVSSYKSLVKVPPTANLNRALEAIRFARRMERISRDHFYASRESGRAYSYGDDDLNEAGLQVASAEHAQPSSALDQIPSPSSQSFAGVLRRPSVAAHEAARMSAISRHWLDVAKPHYGDAFIEGLKSALYMARMLIPLPIYFWLCEFLIPIDCASFGYHHLLFFLFLLRIFSLRLPLPSFFFPYLTNRLSDCQ